MILKIWTVHSQESLRREVVHKQNTDYLPQKILVHSENLSFTDVLPKLVSLFRAVA